MQTETLFTELISGKHQPSEDESQQSAGLYAADNNALSASLIRTNL